MVKIQKTEQPMVKREPKTEIVRKAVIESIIAGKYKAGEVLPSVEQLARDFKVSKNTVSLALANLNENGILDIAHGKYTRITEKLAKPHIMIYSPVPYNLQTTPFWGEFYLGIREVLAEHPEFTSKLYTTVQLFTTEYVPGPLPERVDGFLILGQDNSKELNPLLRKIPRSCPIVSVFGNDQFLERHVTGAMPDYLPAMRDLARHFCAAGVKRCAYIGYMGSSDPHHIDLEKFRIFEKAMRECGIEVPSEWIVECLPGIAYGAAAVHELIKRNARIPDAIFLTSDNLGPGASKALRDMGLRIPDDILLAGCDNLPIGAFTYPTLTTIDLKCREQGHYAMEQLIGAIQNKTAIQARRFPATLVIRESSTTCHAGSVEKCLKIQN